MTRIRSEEYYPVALINSISVPSGCIGGAVVSLLIRYIRLSEVLRRRQCARAAACVYTSHMILHSAVSVSHAFPSTDKFKAYQLQLTFCSGQSAFFSSLVAVEPSTKETTVHADCAFTVDNRQSRTKIRGVHEHNT